MKDIVQTALEKLQKAEAAVITTRQSLEAAQADLAAKQTDKNLIKKVEGLQTSFSAKTAAVGEAKAAYDEAVKQAAAEAAEREASEVTARTAAEKAGSGSAGSGEEKTVSVRIKHKSTGQFYYRCGLRVKKDFETYALPAESLKRLEADPYIVFDEAAR